MLCWLQPDFRIASTYCSFLVILFCPVRMGIFNSFIICSKSALWHI
eukprot:COSAG02_NODE_7334_length_3059_cov_2.657770_1_plen_45_part_10